LKKIALMTILLLSLTIFLLNTPTNISLKDNTYLSPAKIIQITTKAAQKEGINLMYRSICFDVDNKFWRKKLELMDKERAQKYKFLENKNYQAVCLALIEILKGQDIWFFIDKKTGEVLTICKE